MPQLLGFYYILCLSSASINGCLDSHMGVRVLLRSKQNLCLRCVLIQEQGIGGVRSTRKLSVWNSTWGHGVRRLYYVVEPSTPRVGTGVKNKSSTGAKKTTARRGWQQSIVRTISPVPTHKVKSLSCQNCQVLPRNLLRRIREYSPTHRLYHHFNRRIVIFGGCFLTSAS